MFARPAGRKTVIHRARDPAGVPSHSLGCGRWFGAAGEFACRRDGAPWSAHEPTYDGVVAVLLAIRINAPGELSLTDVVQDVLTLSISVIIESHPFVVLGIGLFVVVQVRLPENRVLGPVDTRVRG